MKIHTPEENPYEIINGIMVKKDRKWKIFSTDEYIKAAIKEHGGRYSYDNAVFIALKKPITVTCKFHGDFSITASHHLNGGGCKVCRASRGETKIMRYLDANDIRYVREKTFEDCRNPHTKALFRYDFFLPDYNMLIEFDGQQHKTSPLIFPINSFEHLLGKNLTRDEFKNQYAYNNGYDLIRICYKAIDLVDSYLDEFLSDYIK